MLSELSNGLSSQRDIMPLNFEVSLLDKFFTPSSNGQPPESEIVTFARTMLGFHPDPLQAHVG
jgi:hypothetical protein